MGAKIRVLQVVNQMDRAGLETMLMNYYRNIDRDEIQFDFLTHRDSEGAYDQEIKELGGKVFYAPRLVPSRYIEYFKWMRDFFNNHPEYKIVHSHIDTMSAFPLLAAKINKIPIRIAHSHSTKLDIDYKLPIKYLAKLVVPFVANNYFACGKRAGEFLYGKRDFQVINNACDLDKFEYNEKVRNKKREELGIESSFVVGHVGRYIYIKNQIFLLEIFREILKRKPDGVLLLIGAGQDEEKLRNKAEELGITHNVRFLINRDDVSELYQIMDCFVMPSLFEGLPLVSVEAQANGLTCILSDRISREAELTSSVSFLDIQANINQWVEKIINTPNQRNRSAKDELKANGYDIKIESHKLLKRYTGMENDK